MALNNLEDFREIFNSIISSKEYNSSFAEEIKEIIQIMEEIIYTRQTYQIIFGRINNEIPKEKRSQIEINKLFYDEFEPTLLYEIDLI